MRHKILCIMVIFALLMSVTGCGGNKIASPESQLESPDTNAEEKVETGDSGIPASSDIEITANGQSEDKAVQQDEQQGKPANPVSEDFMMQIEDVFSVAGRGTVATGKILSGHVSVEAEVELVGLADEPRTVTIGGIEGFKELRDTAEAGDNVGVLLNELEKSDVQRGQVLAAKGLISAHNTFSADITFTEEQTDAFFSSGSFNALSYFLTTDSNTVFCFDQQRPDENGILSVRARMLAKLPMKEGTKFSVRRSGEVIAAGVVTGVDVEVNAEPGAENSVIQDNTGLSADEASDAEKSDAGAVNADVRLLNYGDQKIQVIKIIREITGLGLKEAKDLVDNTPSIILKNVTREEAELVKLKLDGAGATVEVTESSPN